MTFSIFFIAGSLGFVFLMGLVFLMQKQASNYIEELEFFVKQKTISTNRERAKLAVLRSRYTQIERENFEMRKQLNITKPTNVSFSGLLAETELIEDQKPDHSTEEGNKLPSYPSAQ